MTDIIQPIITRIDSSANWRTLNPVPKNGEQCIEELGKGLFKLKIGDGVTPWISLAYWTSEGYIDNVENQTILNVTTKYGTKGEYLDLSTALDKLKSSDISLGRLITFESALDQWDLYQFTGSNKTEYLDTTKWERLDKKVESNPDITNLPEAPAIVSFDKKGLVTGYSNIIDCGTF